jgi:mRNA interferase RelE/StbE
VARYSIEFRPAAARDLRKLPRHEQRRVGARIDSLADNPRPAGVRQLAGSEKFYRIRVGDYRIIYEILDKVLRILVLKIGHRRDVYR